MSGQSGQSGQSGPGFGFKIARFQRKTSSISSSMLSRKSQNMSDFISTPEPRWASALYGGEQITSNHTPTYSSRQYLKSAAELRPTGTPVSPPSQVSPPSLSRSPNTASISPTSSTLSIPKTPKTPKTPKSLRSIESFDHFCVYCDLPASYTLASEKVVELQCGHTAHLQCFRQLERVTLDPPCGLCDHPGRLACIVNESSSTQTHTQQNFPFSGIGPRTITPSSFEKQLSTYTRPSNIRHIPKPRVSPRPQSQDPSGHLEPPSPAHSQSSSMYSSEPATKGGEQLSLSSSSTVATPSPACSIAKLYSESQNKRHVMFDSCPPLTIGLVPETKEIAANVKSFKFMVCVSAHTTHATETRAKSMDQDLNKAERFIDSLSSSPEVVPSDRGKLKLVSKMRVDFGVDQNMFDTTCFLFERALVIAQKQTVLAVIETHNTDSIHYVHSTVASTACQGIQLNLSSPPGSKVILNNSSLVVLEQWMAAFLTPAIDTSLSSPDNILTVPVNTVLCLPAPRDSNMVTVLEKSIVSFCQKLRPCDRLGIVIYGPDDVLDISAVEKREWADWSKIISRIPNLMSSKPLNGRTHDPVKALHAAYSSLSASHLSEYAVKSLIFVIDSEYDLFKVTGNLNLSLIDIPIHCVGIGTAHSPNVGISIAEYTSGGSYHFVEHESSLPESLTGILEAEQSVCHKGVTLSLRPRVGMRISAVGDTAEALELDIADNDTHRLVDHTSPERISMNNDGIKWYIDSLYRGECRTMVLEMTVEDERSVSQSGFRDVALINVVVSPPTEPTEQSLTRSVRIPISFGNSTKTSEMIISKRLGQKTAVILETAAQYLSQHRVRKAFQIMNTEHSSLEKLRDSLRSDNLELDYDSYPVSVLEELLSSLLEIYDQFCDSTFLGKEAVRPLIFTMLYHASFLRHGKSYSCDNGLQKLYCFR